ncbi:hypothetical protein [Streptomyces sp. NPDC051001]
MSDSRHPGIPVERRNLVTAAAAVSTFVMRPPLHWPTPGRRITQPDLHTR